MKRESVNQGTQTDESADKTLLVQLESIKEQVQDRYDFAEIFSEIKLLEAQITEVYYFKE